MLHVAHRNFMRYLLVLQGVLVRMPKLYGKHVPYINSKRLRPDMEFEQYSIENLAIIIDTFRVFHICDIQHY